MYQIRNFRRFRRKTEYIILTHARNLQEKMYINNEVLRDNKYYTWGIWQKYWLDDLKRQALPCHYFVERIDTDYVVFKGLNDFQPSQYIEDMVSAGVMKYDYINAILIVIGDDFSMNTVETRLMQHLADKVVTGLLRTHELDFTRVKYIDECLSENWKESLESSTLDYQYKENLFYDKQILLTNINKYKKK